VPSQRLLEFVGGASGAMTVPGQAARCAAHRRRAILVATVPDLEASLTDAALDMADELIGGLFARTRNARQRRFAASAGEMTA
jgi:hypothetical protein